MSLSSSLSPSPFLLSKGNMEQDPETYAVGSQSSGHALLSSCLKMLPVSGAGAPPGLRHGVGHPTWSW